MSTAHHVHILRMVHATREARVVPSDALDHLCVKGTEGVEGAAPDAAVEERRGRCDAAVEELSQTQRECKVCPVSVASKPQLDGA